MTWQENTKSLRKTYSFSDFPSALSWMVQCSFVIEQLGHHPEWTNIYNKVHVTLTTHDAWDIVTDKDLALARLLDEEYEKFISYMNE
jgi:4a-hydroxytetrahydrobiopterin dehydratase